MGYFFLSKASILLQTSKRLLQGADLCWVEIFLTDLL